MPWADPEKNAEAVRKWRAAHPGYWKRIERATPLLPISRYAILDEDISQQKALFKLSRRKSDNPDEFRKRERRWIQATDFWSEDTDGQGSPRRRTTNPDET